MSNLIVDAAIYSVTWQQKNAHCMIIQFTLLYHNRLKGTGWILAKKRSTDISLKHTCTPLFLNHYLSSVIKLLILSMKSLIDGTMG